VVGNFVVEIELAEPSAAKVQFDLLVQTAVVSDVPQLPFNLVPLKSCQIVSVFSARTGSRFIRERSKWARVNC
jgi:hypothetical protein